MFPPLDCSSVLTSMMVLTERPWKCFVCWPSWVRENVVSEALSSGWHLLLLPEVTFLFFVFSWWCLWWDTSRAEWNNFNPSLSFGVQQQCWLHMDNFSRAGRHHSSGFLRFPIGGWIWLFRGHWNRGILFMVSNCFAFLDQYGSFVPFGTISCKCWLATDQSCLKKEQ